MNHQAIFENFIESYSDRQYQYPTLVRHKGTLIAFAMDHHQRLY